LPAAIRSARPEDAEAVAAIYNEGIEERTSTFETTPRTAAEVQSWLTTGDRFPLLVAEENGAVSGWARIQPYSQREAYAGVGEASVYVRRSARGRRLGSRLLGELGAQAERLGYWKLTGKLFTDNAASSALTSRCGWRAVGTHLRHGRLDGAWRDVIVVEVLLGEASGAR
jgi:L-amino acid N-acyltransferase YncA